MIRLLRHALAFVLVLLAAGVIGLKVWLELSGPYLEALPVYPFCQEAELALAEDRVLDALELAEAGECLSVAERAQRRWDSLAATFGRCLDGIWTGRAEDAAGLACAVASDLVVFGDVRDLTRQGLSWTRGEETDLVLVGLSAAGLALTIVPQAGAGASLMKVARRAGTLSDRLAGSVGSLIRLGAWRPLGGLLSDAGRISAKVGPARATRVLAHADSAEELTEVARFVDSAAHPLLALRWGGKQMLRVADDAPLYAEALRRGPAGLLLAAERGAAALLSRKPLLLFAAKTIYRNPEAIATFALALATRLLSWASWELTLVIAAAMLLLAALIRPFRRRGRGRGTGTTPPRPAGFES